MPNIFEEILFELTSNYTRNEWAYQRFCHPAMSQFLNASTNQKNYPDLGSYESWLLWGRFSDVISRGNQWRRREISAVFFNASRYHDGDSRGQNVAFK